MAKIQKLDPKQVPQVIALGVLSLGVFGYALVTFGGSAPKQDAPAKTEAAASTEASSGTSSTTAAGTQMAVSVTEAGGNSKLATSGAPDPALPGQNNPDPFKSSAKPDGAAHAVEVTPKPAPVAPKLTQNAPPLPPAGPGFAAPPSMSMPAPLPLGPERPEVRVTGTSVTEGLNLAILEVGPEHRVVQVGDVVSKGYRVKKIQLQGVVFGKDKDRFFQGVGAKTAADKSDNSLGKSNQF